MIEENKPKRKPRGFKIKPKVKERKKPVQDLRKPRLIGYMRVSTEKQDHTLQYNALVSAGIAPEDVFKDTISGSKIDRKGRDACLKFLVPGDTLVVWKLDRFSRSLQDLLNKLSEMEKLGVGFRSLTQAIDTTTPAGRMMMQMVGAFAEFEREIIRERVKAGIKAKMDGGRERWGKAPAVDYDPEEVKRLLKAGKTQRAVAKAIGISKATVQRIGKE